MNIQEMRNAVKAHDKREAEKTRRQEAEETRQEAEKAKRHFSATHEARTGHNVSSTDGDWASPSSSGAWVIVPKGAGIVTQVHQTSSAVWVTIDGVEFDADDGEGGVIGWGKTEMDAWAHAAEAIE